MAINYINEYTEITSELLNMELLKKKTKIKIIQNALEQLVSFVYGRKGPSILINEQEISLEERGTNGEVVQSQARFYLALTDLAKSSTKIRRILQLS